MGMMRSRALFSVYGQCCVWPVGGRERERETLAFGKQVTFTTCMLSGSLFSLKVYLEKQCNVSSMSVSECS